MQFLVFSCLQPVKSDYHPSLLLRHASSRPERQNEGCETPEGWPMSNPWYLTAERAQRVKRQAPRAIATIPIVAGGAALPRVTHRLALWARAGRTAYYHRGCTRLCLVAPRPMLLPLLTELIVVDFVLLFGPLVERINGSGEVDLDAGDGALEMGLHNLLIDKLATEVEAVAIISNHKNTIGFREYFLKKHIKR